MCLGQLCLFVRGSNNNRLTDRSIEEYIERFILKRQIDTGIARNTSGMVNENVLESDFEPLCDGTTRRRSLADLRLLEGM